MLLLLFTYQYRFKASMAFFLALLRLLAHMGAIGLLKSVCGYIVCIWS